MKGRIFSKISLSLQNFFDPEVVKSMELIEFVKKPYFFFKKNNFYFFSVTKFFLLFLFLFLFLFFFIFIGFGYLLFIFIFLFFFVLNNIKDEGFFFEFFYIRSSLFLKDEKRRTGIIVGSFLFILTEFFFFLSFCWFFLDRTITFFFGNLFFFFEKFDCYRWYDNALFFFLLFYFSLLCLFIGMHFLFLGESEKVNFFFSVVIFCGCFFLYFESYEFYLLLFGISSGIFGSMYFFFIGFHAFHTIVCLLFFCSIYVSYFIRRISLNKIVNFYKKDNDGF